MGYKFRGSCNRESRSHASRDSCKPHSNYGMVQQQALKSMEEHLLTDRNKCEGGQSGFLRSSMGRDNEHVMGFLDRCAATNGDTLSSPGIHTANLTNAHSVQSEFNGEYDREKNAEADRMEFEGGGQVDASFVGEL